MKNLDLRVRKGSISYGRIAEEVGVHLNTIRRWFNDDEMDPVQTKRVMQAITKIEQEEQVS